MDRIKDEESPSAVFDDDFFVNFYQRIQSRPQGTRNNRRLVTSVVYVGSHTKDFVP